MNSSLFDHDTDTVGFVTRQPVYAGSVVRTPRKPRELYTDAVPTYRNLSVQTASQLDVDNPFDLD